MVKIYNIQKGLPLSAKLPTGKHRLNSTIHARREAIAKMEKHRLTQKIEIPLIINFSITEIVEIEAEKGIVLKVVCRIPYNEEYDVVFPVVLGPEGKLATTVWLNSKTDDHSTLNMDKYADPSEFELDIE